MLSVRRLTATARDEVRFPARIIVVGLGPGGLSHLTVGALRELVQAERLFLRTARHPMADDLKRMGVAYQSFDSVYDAGQDFESVYDQIAMRLLEAAAESPVTYAVPGHPTVAEASVSRLLRLARARDTEVQLLPGLSWMDTAYISLGLDPSTGSGLVLVDALEHDVIFHPEQNYLITQVYDRLVAGDLKIRLADAFGDTHRIKVLHHAGLPDEKTVPISLYRLDRLDWVDHLTSVYVPALSAAKRRAEKEPEFPLDPIVEIVKELRGEHGCPWDKAQTHVSLKPYMIEESYEAWEAIDEGDSDKLCDELGDLLLQIVLHAQLGAEAGAFDINDVVAAISEKMVRRHPHVFGEVQVGGVGDVLRNWDQIKKGEKGAKERKSALDGIPGHLPGLMAAQKIQSKAAKVGFEWEDIEDAVKKVWEEARELRQAHKSVEAASADDGEREKKQDRLEEEVGDLIFAVANVARYLKVNAEVALRRTIDKFYRRFRHIEKACEAQGRKLADLTLDEMESLWQEAKTKRQRKG